MTIHHIVLLKFKQGISPADADEVRARFRGMPSQIPAISSIKYGKKVKNPMDHDFDEGFILVFKDEDALKEYIPHKAHREHQAFAKSYVEDLLVFDIYPEE